MIIMKYHWISKDGKYGCFLRHGKVYRYTIKKNN